MALMIMSSRLCAAAAGAAMYAEKDRARREARALTHQSQQPQRKTNTSYVWGLLLIPFHALSDFLSAVTSSGARLG